VDAALLELLRKQEARREARLVDGRYKREGRNKACRTCSHVKAKHKRGARCGCSGCTCRRFQALRKE